MGPLRFVKHEQFVRQYIKHGGNGAQAYRKLYPNCRSYGAARAAASRLLRYPHVRRRYKEVLTQMVKRTDITIEKILTDFQYVIDAGKNSNKLSEVVSAATQQAKIVGLMREKIETGAPGDFDNIDTLDELIAMVEREAGPEAAQKLIKALDLEAEKTQAEEDTTELAQAPPASEALN